MTSPVEQTSGPDGEPAKHRVKVAVLVGALDVGGAELDIVRNFPRLNREEFEVVVVSFGTRGPLGPELERQGVPVIARADAVGIIGPAKPPKSRVPLWLRWHREPRARRERMGPPWWYRLYSSLVMAIPADRRQAIKRILRGDWHREPRARHERVGPPWWYRLYSSLVMAIPANRRQAIKRFLSGEWYRQRRARRMRLGPPWWYRMYSKLVMTIPPQRRQAIKSFLREVRSRREWGAIKRFWQRVRSRPEWRAMRDSLHNLRFRREWFEAIKRFLGRFRLSPESRQAIKSFVRLDWLRRDWRGIIRRAARRVAAPFTWAREEFDKSRPVVWVRRRMSTARYIADVTFWIRDTLVAENTEIVHFFLPHSYVYGMFATAFMRPKPKTVMSRLSLNFYKGTHYVIAWLERNLLHRLLGIAIGNSTKILDELVQEGVPRRRVRLLYNGIDPEPLVRHADDRARAREELGIESDAFVIVAVGNLHTYKGHNDLIEACSGARSRLPEHWQLLIAGRDETGNRAKYEALVGKLGLEDHIHLLGPCDNVPQLLFAADVFAHPSHHEGLPNAIIEAMAASLPVIGTTVGGLPEAVRSNGDPAETGWLVPPFEPDSLAAALLEAAADRSRRCAMGARARERVEAQFSLTHSVATYEAIYRELLPECF